MSREIIIHDARGRRTCSSSDFPLGIGAGPEADIRLPGLSGEAVHVLLGISDSHVFAQPAGEGLEVYLNDQPLGDSRWLAHGDTIRVAGTEVRFEAGASTVSFIVDVEAPQVVPPGEPPPPSTAVAIEPVTLDTPVAVQPSRPRRRLWSLMALATFVVLALAAGFVFLAVPVSLRITPAPATLTVTGLLPGVQVGDRRLLIPGSYRVRATRAGYQALDETVDVSSEGHQELEFVLQKLPGIVTIESRPVTGARVSIDGEPRGRTPLHEVELAPGTHEIVVRAERYSDASVTLEVEGLGNRQGVSIELTPRWAAISLDSVPPGATVSLDGEGIGETPLNAEVLEGSYRLEVSRPGFDTVSTTLNVIANQPQSLAPFELVESDGLLSLDSNPTGATVSVAGEFRGRTPLQLSLAPRVDHPLRLSLAGFETLERRVRLDPAAEEQLVLTLSPRYGSLFIIADPADAELYVDGKRQGAAGGRIRLTTRKHTLSFRKEGYETFETTVTPRAGVSQQVSVSLKTTEAARIARRKPIVETAAGQRLRLVQPEKPFLMGASRREQGRRANETVRRVELTRPFYLGVKEVSNAEYRQFAKEHSSGTVAGKSVNDASQPVARVTWEDAVRYLNWLSARDALPPAYRAEGKTFVTVSPPTIGYRLPTEAEWAYAARFAAQPMPRKYPWGSTFPPTGSVGNFADRSAETFLPNTLADYDDGYPVSSPVGSFSPSPLGFHDLGGNVAEWCHDYYTIYPNAPDRVVTDPQGPRKGRHHVVRGSSWRHASISELRLSFRDYGDEARSDLGFRIARYVD